MLKWFTSMFWRDKLETPTLTNNSMSPIPKRKFLNLARIVVDTDDDKEPHTDIYHLKRIERLKKKRDEDIFDKFNH